MALHPDFLDDGGVGIHFCEYKILLKAEGYDSPGRFKEFWHDVRHVAKECGVDYDELPHDPHVREVQFFDTADFHMYNGSFILRKRHRVEHGFPVDEELTFKYRHSDAESAAAIDVRSSLSFSSRIKFKEEVLLDTNNVGGSRSIFSHNFVAMNTDVMPRGKFGELVDIFSVLGTADAHPDTTVDVVNNVHVTETSIDLAELHFGNHYKGKANLAIWRLVGNRQPLVGEFAFQCKFKHYEDVSEKARKRSENFYSQLQHRLKDQIDWGTTKTALIYKMGSKPVTNTHG